MNLDLKVRVDRETMRHFESKEVVFEVYTIFNLVIEAEGTLSYLPLLTAYRAHH
jgi:hypothetical protein